MVKNTVNLIVPVRTFSFLLDNSLFTVGDMQAWGDNSDPDGAIDQVRGWHKIYILSLASDGAASDP